MDSNITLRYFRYRRKSSEDNKERQAASLEEQAYVLDGIEAHHNIKAIADLEESKSAHTTGREIFDKMLERIEAGEANAILTWHPNRICRNMTDGGKVIDLMDKGMLLEIRTPFRTYHNTPEDKWLLTLEFANSKKDSDDKSIAVKRGLDKKNRDGWRPGVAPEGYLNDRTTESGFRKIPTDRERFPFIVKIFELFYTGTAVIKIHRIAKDEWHYRTRQKKRLGGKPLTISMIYWVLTNPFYMGKYEYPKGSGNWYEGKQEKAVSEAIFNEIQVRLGRRSPYRINGQEFAFSATMRCGICNSGIVAEQKWQVICRNCKVKFSLTKNNKDKCIECGTLIANMKNPTILHYVYYRCGKKKNRLCLEKGIRVDRLETQVLDKLGKLTIPDCFLEWAIEQIRTMGEQDHDFEKKTIDATRRAYQESKQKLQNLLQLKISPVNSDSSLLSDNDYKVQKQALEQELKTLEQQLGGSAEKQQEADENTKRAVTFAIRAQQRFAKGDPKVKRDIFMGLGLHPKLQDRIVKFDSPKYLLKVEEMKKDIDKALVRVAPINQIYLQSQTGAFLSSIPTMLRGRELRPTCEIMSLTCTVHYPARKRILAEYKIVVNSKIHLTIPLNLRYSISTSVCCQFIYMAKSLLRLEARKLRKKGVSVKKIAQYLKVAKSSASIWTRDIILTVEQLENLRKSSLEGAERGRLKSAFLQKEKWNKNMEEFRKLGIANIGKLTDRELLIAGLALYWGEGYKKGRRLQFCNSDPKMIKFVLLWLQRCFPISSSDIRCRVGINYIHIKRDDVVKKYWSEITGIPLVQFTKTSFKKVENKKIYANFNNYYGTLSVEVSQPARFYGKIIGLIEGLSISMPT